VDFGLVMCFLIRLSKGPQPMTPRKTAMGIPIRGRALLCLGIICIHQKKNFCETCLYTNDQNFDYIHLLGSFL
jgi:hypothetical protein